MIYIYRIRRLVQVVVDEMAETTDPMAHGSRSSLEHCLVVFRSLNKRYTPELSRKILAIATGKNYLKIEGNGRTPQRLIVGDEGVILLTRAGYINALVGSVSNVIPLAPVVISLFALWVAIQNHK